MDCFTFPKADDLTRPGQTPGECGVFLWFWGGGERENGDRGSTQHFAADLVTIVVGPREPSLKTSPEMKKSYFCENGHALKHPEVLVSQKQCKTQL